MRLVIDMNMSPDWVDRLRVAGHDVLHWSSVGAADAADDEILHWARERDRTILTSDLDFGTLLAMSGAQKPSVVQLRLGTTLSGRVGDLVERILRQTEADLAAGALVTIEADRLRLRPLAFLVDR